MDHTQTRSFQEALDRLNELIRRQLETMDPDLADRARRAIDSGREYDQLFQHGDRIHIVMAGVAFEPIPLAQVGTFHQVDGQSIFLVGTDG